MKIDRKRGKVDEKSSKICLRLKIKTNHEKPHFLRGFLRYFEIVKAITAYFFVFFFEETARATAESLIVAFSAYFAIYISLFY